MQQLYDVELTDTAEKSYIQLYDRAQAYLEVGRDKHPAVTAFNEVENALSATLPTNPCVPCRALAGRLSAIYRLPLGSVSISYTVNAGKMAVIVLTITQTERSRSIRMWLNNALEKGEVDDVLKKLGIEKPYYRIQVNSRWLH